MLKKNMLMLAGFVLSSSIGMPYALAGIEGSITGIVQDTAGSPVALAEVELLHPTRHTSYGKTQTSTTGEFHFFSVLFGSYQIRTQSGTLPPVNTQVHVASGSTSTIRITLPASQKPEDSLAQKEMRVEVIANKKWLHSPTAVSSVELDQEIIRKLPQGDQVKLPELLTSTTPGMVQGPFGQMFIRGNHASIQYQVDGVQLPDSPSSTFGEAFSPRNIDHMEVITGGIPAEYGERLAAVVNIVTKAGTEKPEGTLELNYGTFNRTSPQLTYGGSNSRGDFHYYLSANYSRTDRGLDTPQPVSETQQNQGGTQPTHDLSHAHNEFMKLDWLVDNENKLSLTAFNSSVFYQIPNFPSSFRQTDAFFGQNFEDVFGNEGGNIYRPASTNDTQSERNNYLQVVWKHTLSPQSFFQIAPYWKYSTIRVTNDFENDTVDPEGSSFAINRHTNNVGLKGDFSVRTSDRNLFKAGFQVQASQSNGSIFVYHDGNSSMNSDPNFGLFENFYIQDDFTILPALTLNAGARLSATQFSFSGIRSSDSMLQPRIGLNYLITDNTKLHAFYGRLFQPAPLENLRVTYNNLGLSPELLPYDIQAEKDHYYEVGIAQQFLDTHVAALNLYYKKGTNIIDDEQIPNTSIAQPFNFAQGYAYGVELALRGQLSSEWSEYINYSYNLARGRGLSGGVFVFAEDPDDAPGSHYQILDHVQLHTLNSGLTYTKNNFWATAQGLFGSGLRTGPNNSRALPGHFSMNTTLGYQFRKNCWLSNWKVSLDILNIFNNTYPITIANGYNGSHYAAGRQFFLHVTRNF